MGQQSLLPERFHHSDMEIKVGPGPAHQKGRAAIAMLRPPEEIELLLKRDIGHFGAGKIFQRIYDRIDIVLDQLLRTEFRFLIQPSMPHAIHISVDALIQRVQKACVILRLPQCREAFEAAADRLIVKMLAFVSFLPFVDPGGLVVGLRRFRPFGIAVGLRHGFFHFQSRGQDHVRFTLSPKIYKIASAFREPVGVQTIRSLFHFRLVSADCP